MADAAADGTNLSVEPVIAPEVLDNAVQHMYSDTAVEMGGFFVGRLEEKRAHIDAVVPALRAPSSRVNLTFDHDTWMDVVNTVDRDYGGKTIVGWFHSHPGHGVFLSGYDTFIHESFFVAEGMVALVVDPTDGSAGWFSTASGSIGEPVRTSVPPAQNAGNRAGGDRVELTERRRGGGLAGLAVAVLIGAILGAGAGYAYAGSTDVDQPASSSTTPDPEMARQTSELTRQQAEVARLQGEVDALANRNSELELQVTATPDSTGSDVYVIAEGDTLSGIAQRLLGDANQWDRIYNHASNPTIIGTLEANASLPGGSVGKTIKIPTD